MEIKYRIELPKLLKHLGLPLIGVEIGVAEGNNSRDLLENGMEIFHSVDSWTKLNQKGDGGYEQAWHDENYRQAKEKLSKYPGSTIIKTTSVNAAQAAPDEYYSLLYLDGDHSYEGVKSDLDAWYPKVVKGGVIAGHDYKMGHYGVNQAVNEFANKLGVTVTVIPENKDDDAGFYFIKPC